MNWKEKLKVGVWSAIGGAIVLAIIGFAWGGWVTGGTAQEKAEEMAEKAVIDHLAPICVSQFLKDPNREERFEQLKAKDSWMRGDYVKEIGWATMPGAESPARGVSDECARLLMELKR